MELWSAVSAAMEPVLGGRDDLTLLGDGRIAAVAPQWSPVLGGRDDGATMCLAMSASTGPQWSPSLADGTTLPQTAGALRDEAPQWSPSLADGTTRLAPRGDARPRSLAAMEPVLGGRDDRTGQDGTRGGYHVAAMEPVLGGRDDSRTSAPARAASLGRNGARPWRTGRPGARSPDSRPATRPQWSPSLADGTTGTHHLSP